MLVVTRKIGESIVIGDDIQIILVEIKGRDKVRLAIDAPKDVSVDRIEVRRSKDKEKRNERKA